MSGRPRRLALAVVIAALATVPAASAKSVATRYYVALGDSLSVGVQPNQNGVELRTSEGYTNHLATMERSRIPSLQLVEFGCPGDSTTRLITGHGDPAGARRNHCDRAGGSQLIAATRFLRSHHKPGEIALITIDIGANDIDTCGSAGAKIFTCITQGEASVKRNTPKILHAINAAARPGTPRAGMTLYDPDVVNFFTPSKRGLAIASVAILHTINIEIQKADRDAGWKTADLSSVFDTYDYTDTTTFDGQTVPIDLARVCSFSWFCTPPPSGPDIHLNENGYAVAAGVFASVLGPLG